MRHFTARRRPASRALCVSRTAGRASFRLLLLGLLLAAACAALTACSVVEQFSPQTAQEVGGPNLNLISLTPYIDPEVETTAQSTDDVTYTTVDLWLDATQNMGGINTNEDSIYPHSGKKYREGGFHYRYGDDVGWYENVLRAFLSISGENNVRVLRNGNETMSDAFLTGYRLPASGSDAGRSVWRDMHTCAIGATSSLFKQMSAENMSDSFYSLGSPTWLNRLATLNSMQLENPDLAGLMSDALNAQMNGIAAGEAGFAYKLENDSDRKQCALYSAIENLDLSRLSIITVDPTSVTVLSEQTIGSDPVDYYVELLNERGVFQAGLCVGVLDFQLDYIGQMTTLSTAHFSEPLLWGRLLVTKNNQFMGLGAMPRRLITLVIGTRARVETLISRLQTAFDKDPELSEERGPSKGELSYTANGQTVVQQPFGFEWNHTLIVRPSMGFYSQHTQGATLTVTEASGTQEGTQWPAAEPDGLLRLTFSPDAEGAQPDQTLVVRFPITSNADGAKLDINRLVDMQLSASSSLLMERTVANTAQNRASVAEGEKLIPYRDLIYVFKEGAQSDAFTLQSIVQEGDELVCQIAVNGDLLKVGYYRLLLSADATGDQVAWDAVPWIDGEQTVSTTVNPDELQRWVEFTALITKYERGKSWIPPRFQSAWGDSTESYHGEDHVPDFPPVYRSIGLQTLTEQLRKAASSETSSLIRYVFEVYVPNR